MENNKDYSVQIDDLLECIKIYNRKNDFRKIDILMLTLRDAVNKQKTFIKNKKTI